MTNIESRTALSAGAIDKMIIKAAVHVAVDRVLTGLRSTCNDLADKMERGELPMQSGPSALRMVAMTVDAERQQREGRTSSTE